ncbi:hypothetical protein H5P36_14170 [Bacillus sp. APMAM]|nr:hypothetical protein [Bacillus sp. APMAM]
MALKRLSEKKNITNPNYGIRCTVPMSEYLASIIEMNKKALRILAKRGF